MHYCEKLRYHDDVIKWKHFPRSWPFVWGIHRSPVNSRNTGQWRGALMFSSICAWINNWANNREAGDLRRHRGHYDVIVMIGYKLNAHIHMNKYFQTMTRSTGLEIGLFGNQHIRPFPWQMWHQSFSLSWWSVYSGYLDANRPLTKTPNWEQPDSIHLETVFKLLFMLCMF